MDINLRGNMVLQDLSIDEALALQAGLADAIRQALKYGQCCGPTVAAISKNLFGERSNPVPLAVSFNVYQEKPIKG